MSTHSIIRPRRALFSCSDKTGIEKLGLALSKLGVDIVATGKTAEVLAKAGIQITPVEKLSGSPEAFAGRMKTLSFPLLSGVLYRRGDAADEADVRKLKVPAIDVVVVNFYPFENDPRIEQIDVGGPTLVRAAAKNAPDVLCLISPDQYEETISQLGRSGGWTAEWAQQCAARTWTRVSAYDQAIERVYGGAGALRYGENPHQQASFSPDPASPIDWRALTAEALSYNNILDISSAYSLLQGLVEKGKHAAVIIKHGGPCGVAVSSPGQGTMLGALQAAWSCDPVSAFGGVVALSHPLDDETSAWLSTRFIEAVIAPQLEGRPFENLCKARKKLKAVSVRTWDWKPTPERYSVVGGVLEQTRDLGVLNEECRSVTQAAFPKDLEALARFGVHVVRALKSNAVGCVGQLPNGTLMLVGSGQGQPNRVEAIEALCLPRSRKIAADVGLQMSDLLLVSDAFFPFPDSVEKCAAAGIRWIVQPGGSIKDSEVIAAADRLGVGMAFTGRRHFKHL